MNNNDKSIYMRLILMFDLEMNTEKEKKEYLHFKKTLDKNGYIMIQYSIYTKWVNFQTKINSEINKIKYDIPKRGNIRIIVVTEKQYNNMYYLLGEKTINESYSNKKRYVKI